MGESQMTKRLVALAGIVSTALVSACGVEATNQSGSSVKVVDMAQSQVKWQSIGNCWVYAAVGWIESQVLKFTGEELNISESYLSYRHFESQLISGRSMTEVQTGGFWHESKRLVLTYGLINEGDFIPSESENTFSASQDRAVKYLNNSLQNGLLKSDRTAATVRAELDAAFGVKLADVQSKIYKASDLVLGKNADGSLKTVDSEIRGWNRINFPADFANYPDESELPVVKDKLTSAQKSLLQRVKRALNDGQPVVMNWWVDFNGLDDNGIFSLENVAAKGSGRQGYHQTVIEDYVVSGVNPETGESFFFGEGDATPEQKRIAELYGEIEYFVVKNSWGGAERLNRPSYARFGEKGYSRLEASYLFGWMRQEEDGEFQGAEKGLGGFILPAGY